MSRQASGLWAWLIQRLSAVYVGLFGAYLLARLVISPPADHAALVEWLGSGPVALGFLLLIPLLLLHAWVGIRDVLIDYIKPAPARIGLLILFAVVLLGSGLWAVQSVFLARLAALAQLG